MDARFLNPIRRRVARAPAAAVAIGCFALPAVAQSDDAADARRLIEVLGVGSGSVVADVGAGSGVLTVPIARHVGPTGLVYATDINPERLADLREAARTASLDNVVVIEGAPAETNLPDACCDAVFMRFVYHHFADPASMNANLYRALKPGTRLAVVDFAPRSGRSAPAGGRNEGESHGVTPATVIEELSAAGFVRVRQLEWTSSGAFLVVAERPP